jgi:hypothetical protein
MPAAANNRKPRAARSLPHVTARFTLGFDMRIAKDDLENAAIPVHTMSEFRSLISSEHSAKLCITPSVPLFRQLATEGMIDEVHISFQPRLIGGKSSEPITGIAPAFIPRSVPLDLISTRRRGAEYLATYRVRTARQGRIEGAV